MNWLAQPSPERLLTAGFPNVTPARKLRFGVVHRSTQPLTPLWSNL
ncbi:MAG: hypothetical protein Q6L50_06860 [Gloeomargarita sp. GMQP_bins_120]